ncbi:YgfZ/GcvT domain-containing protein [Pseudoalteromonas luteoviolacea]|uniref:CAF17-like 4Fe-4S cluster assembly/insertion protein YgfZ n=1 Tax=Pseudoalteromonas luteoviolacea TaxID=43657 RepID=UPI001B396E78|nr:transcriptional regulator [Pseudoalteromonas luteoviolacea]MBQ4836135.1 transcriptional regulator [Pseudoalteromonas luteoviolacea]
MATVYQLPLRLLLVSGQDKLSYLHGQVTQDMNLVQDNNFLWTGHCSPKGKLWAALRVLRLDDAFCLLGSQPEAEAACRELSKYGVFAKVDINLSEHQCFGVLADSFDEVCHTFNLQFDTDNNACSFNGGKALKIDDSSLILILENTTSLPTEYTVELDSTTFEVRDILAGEPQLGEHGIDEFVPQMVNLQALNGISFKKGCYTGQETVARMRYLGKNKRAMFIVQGQSESSIEVQDLEMQLDEGNWRRAGKVIRQTYDAATKTYYALAVLPNDLENSAVLRPKDNLSVSLNIKALPYSIEDN